MDNKVKVKNLISSRVVLVSNDQRLRRVWEKKGAVKTIPFEQLEEAMYEPGVEALFRDGILGIDDMEIKIALGLEPEGAAEPVNVIVLSDEQRKRYMTVLPVNEFKQKVKELSGEQIEELARYAIQNKLMDVEKSAILKKMCGIDVIKVIELNHADEEKIQEN